MSRVKLTSNPTGYGRGPGRNLEPMVGSFKPSCTAAIGPSHSPSAIHLVVAPLPLIFSAVRKAICPVSIHAVLLELAHVSRAIGSGALSMAVFHGIPILALEFRAV